MDTSTFFDGYYNNASVNCIVVTDDKGIILNTNKAFCNNFGYSQDELNGQHFRVLFTLPDRNEKKPEAELAKVLSTGNSFDENFLLNKDGKEIWITGESMLVKTKTGTPYIIKDIVNLQSKNQLRLFTIEAEDLMERIFEGNKETSMIVLDGMGKIIKVNQSFLNQFEIAEMPLTAIRLTQLNHPFWNNADVRSEIRNIIVKNKFPAKTFVLETTKGEKIPLKFNVKVLGREERKVYIIIEESAE